jgi:glycosyltransferase involved in cell wall biosynthesis
MESADWYSYTIENDMKICAVIPAYNEELTIGKIIKETKKYIDTIYVVNNGSTDRTADIALENGAEVINYSDKRGYGASQYAGQQHALQQGFNYILQLDADGQHDPAYIPELINTMQSLDCDIVLGSRFITNNTKINPVRYVGINFFSLAVSILGRTRITDVTSGFKIYKANSLRKLSKPCDTHPAVEQMMEMAKKNMTIKEVPIIMPQRTAGESHLSVIKFALYPFRALWLIIKVILFK